jgi:putative transcriptional regulator
MGPFGASAGGARVDVKQIRRGLGLTQPEFAQRFGFNIGTLRNWEQGQRKPSGPSRVLLMLIERAPQLVQNTLGVDVAH